ncbi:hypothetical protein OSTOST_22882, partial [Ostertagia ostertagi]
MELLAISNKLETFNDCNDRIYADEQSLVMDDNGNPLICVFCQDKGKHEPNNCPNVRIASERKEILKRCQGCWFCLKNHIGTCAEREACEYCGKGSHNKALC